MANEKTTWDLDAIRDDELELALLVELCNTNDGAICIPHDEFGESYQATAESLRKLGLIIVDHGSEDVGLSLTTEGEAWLRSLPEGALS